MDIKNYIKIYDNFLSAQTVSSILLWLNTQKFSSASIVGHDSEIVNEGVRKTEELNLMLTKKSSQTNIHWHNYLISHLSNFIRQYALEVSPFDGIGARAVKDLTALKYQKTGFYKFHTDHHPNYPRTLTAIILLNNEYKGGELEFGCSFDHKTILKVEPTVGRLIVWPSNFMYPHRVNPVTEGIRYSLVSWVY
jgi:predicted 2-oxoglutarate/Fe(II)-dependent dioxygenase YbiX